MADLEKLYEKAEKYLQKQKYEAALEAYQEIYRYDPNEEEVLLNLGDLSLKLNRTAEALRYEAILTDYYIKRNDSSKAIVTCRKILKLSPTDLATLTKLAGLLEKTQKNSEALQIYREALDLNRKAGASAQAMDCLQHIVKLDPGNVEAHVELGELAARARQPKVATSSLLRAAQLSREAGQEDRWADLVERAHLLDPADEAGCIAAAEVSLKKNRPAEAVALLEPLSQGKPDDLMVLELLTRGYTAVGDYAKAQPLCWKLYQAKPETQDIVLKLVEGLLQTGAADKGVALLGKVKERLFQQGKRNDFLKILEKLYESDESNLEVLEMLTNLYNEMNKEDGLRRSLTRLFNLYLAGEQYDKAADALERILDVDPYGEGHYDRLVNLEGHIDTLWYKNIQVRVQPPSTARAAAAPGAASAAAAAAKTAGLDDLIVEGEMYFQYQLSTKLAETVEKIHRLFPGAEERSPRLRELYDLSGFSAKLAPAEGQVAAPAAARAEPERAPVPSAQLDELRKISEITANIYREATPHGVMQVAVNQLGRALNVSRCWGALGGVDRPPALTVEYCSPAASPSDLAAALKLYAALMRQALTSPDGWAVPDVSRAPLLGPLTAEIQKLGIKSLLALPLLDKEEATGLLVMEQCDTPRAWSADQTLLLKAITTQVVIAVNNTKLRRLVRSLAGSDPETGLLPRSSYVDCLLSEAQRSKDQGQPLCVCLIEPENPPRLMKTLGDAGVQRYLTQVSKSATASLRQNDIAIRYSPLALALVLPDTALPQAGLAVEKVRRVISQVKLDGATAPNFCAVVCDVPLGRDFDAVDGVTEVLNRLEASLERARQEGGKQILLSKFEG